MANPAIIPFRAHHLLDCANRDNGNATYREIMALAVEKEEMGHAFSAVMDERIIMCAGIVILWPGVGTAWTVLSHEIIQHKIWMTRMVRRVLNDIARSHNLHRIETVVLKDSDVSRKWIEVFGFREEGGVAQKYTSDRKDAVRYEYLPCKR